MERSDETVDYDFDEIFEKFPVAVTENLRTDKRHTRIAVINDFASGTLLYELSDPHLENGAINSAVFYHTFAEEDAQKAEKEIKRFEENGHGQGEYEVELYRKEGGAVFLYANGELHTELPLPVDKLKECGGLEWQNCYILPIKIYAFPCPVCGERVNQFRGRYEICPFCGWEDNGAESRGENSDLGLFAESILREYRAEYKKQLYRLHPVPFETLTKEEKVLPIWHWINEEET